MNSSRFIFASRLALILTAAPVIPALLGLSGPALRAQAPTGSEEDGELGESPERYAQVKILEGSATIHKGDGQEELTRGTPVTEGDVVESRGRGVLQLADGTRIAFGPSTRFRVAGLFQERGEGREVMLRLDQGRLRIRMGSQSEAALRIDTPSGSGTATTGAEVTFDMDREEVLRIRVHAGRVNAVNERGRQLVRAGERLTVYGPKDSLDRLNDFNTYDEDAFDQWAEPLLLGHRSESASRVPREIRYFADDLDAHGRWVYVDECHAQCWVPAGVGEDWRPYYDGRWAPYAGGMTWISPEPWGYVTYHHGRWGWRAGLGWYWIPGVYYSPAWVAWQSDAAYFGWAPLGYYNRPCSWGYGAWGGGACWNVVNITYINAPRVHVHVYNDVRVIGSFNRGLGDVPAGPRGPWFRSRMMVTPAEFRNPVQIRQVASQPSLIRARVAEYDRGPQNRVILRREGPPPQNPVARPQAPGGFGFEHDLPRRPGRPILREMPPQGGPAPAAPGRPAEAPGQPARPQPAPLPRLTPKDRPRWEDSQERPGLPRPRPEARQEAPAAPAPAREERRIELPRERPREERRPDPPQERPRLERPAPPRQEARPVVLPRQESRPSAPARSERPDRPDRPDRPNRDNKENRRD